MKWQLVVGLDLLAQNDDTHIISSYTITQHSVFDKHKSHRRLSSWLASTLISLTLLTGKQRDVLATPLSGSSEERENIVGLEEEDREIERDSFLCRSIMQVKWGL